MTTEVRYYHLERSRLEDALPLLLERTLERKWRAVVMIGTKERIDPLSEHLWTHNDRSFIAHGTERDGHPDLQPVWLTAEDENPNGANVLFLLDGAVSSSVGGYEIVCRLFDGRDSQAVSAARSDWKQDKEAGYKLTYWQQTDRGWEKKAEI